MSQKSVYVYLIVFTYPSRNKYPVFSAKNYRNIRLNIGKWVYCDYFFCYLFRNTGTLLDMINRNRVREKTFLI